MPYSYPFRALRYFFTLVATVLAFGAAAQAPAWQLALVAGQPGTGTAQVFESATDASGNVYLVGFFNNSVSFGSTTLTAVGGDDVFIARWNKATGTFTWAQRAGGTGSEYGYGIAVSGTNVYVSGIFASPTATFGSTTLLNAAATGVATSDVFVAKLTDAGVFVWAKRAGGAGTEANNTVAVSGTSVYLNGTFLGASTSFDGITLLNAGPAYTVDCYVAKLTDAGTTASFGWAQRFGSISSDDCSGLAASGSNVYVGGSFGQTADFGSLTLTSSANSDVFVAKLTDAGPTGSFTWAQRAGGPGLERVDFLTASGPNVYVGGSFGVQLALGASATFGSTTLSTTGVGDAFVAKLTDAGPSASWAWAKQAGNQSLNGNGEIWGLKANGSNVFVVGTFLNSSQGFGSTAFASAGAQDIFVAKLLDAGSSATTTWTQHAGGPDTEQGFALCLAPGTVYVAGYTKGNPSFGTIALASPVGQSAGFLAALPDATVLATKAATAASLGIAVYPTPATTVVTVELPATRPAGAAILTVLDALGRTVRTRTTTPAPGTHRTDLSVAGLAPGVYTLHAAVAQAVGTARLVVE